MPLCFINIFIKTISITFTEIKKSLPQPLSIATHTTLVKTIAQELGFSFCGISRAARLHSEEPKLSSWLEAQHHGKMSYMENHFEMRLDPRLLVEGARSVVSLMYNYYPAEQQSSTAPKISKYAYGEDYHKVIKDKLHLLLERLREQIGDIAGRCFTDSAPILERAWAQQSGLGWIGKNGNLINPKRGSFYLLSELILDLELEPDSPMPTDHCGTCTACIDACPTAAILPTKVIAASQCISYLTIELKENLAPQAAHQDWVFGCDICQDVCPWNRFSITHQEPRFQIHAWIQNYDRKQWLEITEDIFKKEMKHSPLSRAGYQKLMTAMQDLR